jgi:hypothetical protein
MQALTWTDLDTLVNKLLLEGLMNLGLAIAIADSTAQLQIEPCWSGLI